MICLLIGSCRKDSDCNGGEICDPVKKYCTDGKFPFFKSYETHPIMFAYVLNKV